jgi:hypothetical protein
MQSSSLTSPAPDRVAWTEWTTPTKKITFASVNFSHAHFFEAVVKSSRTRPPVGERCTTFPFPAAIQKISLNRRRARRNLRGGPALVNVALAFYRACRLFQNAWLNADPYKTPEIIGFSRRYHWVLVFLFSLSDIWY